MRFIYGSNGYKVETPKTSLLLVMNDMQIHPCIFGYYNFIGFDQVTSWFHNLSITVCMGFLYGLPAWGALVSCCQQV